MNISPPTTSLDVTASGVQMVALAGGVWRIISTRGAEMLGHLEAVDDERGRRYRAKRFVVRERRFRVIGEFWTATDAVDAVRFG
jgi:hypothetical protein